MIPEVDLEALRRVLGSQPEGKERRKRKRAVSGARESESSMSEVAPEVAPAADSEAPGSREAKEAEPAAEAGVPAGDVEAISIKEEEVRAAEAVESLSQDRFRMHNLGRETVVVWASGGSLDTDAAAVMALICREILADPALRTIVFDFWSIDRISTAALGLLVRFRNTAVLLDKRVRLVAGPLIRLQIRQTRLDGVLDLAESVYDVLEAGTLVSYLRTRHEGDDKYKIEGGSLRSRAKRIAGTGSQGLSLLLKHSLRRRRRWLVIGLVIIFLLVLGLGLPRACAADLPPLETLERMLADSPDLRLLELGIEQERRRGRWLERITIRGNYSQNFSSAVPFVPTPELAVAGGTFIGLSAAVPLAVLLGHDTARDLNLPVKEMEYRALYRSHLTELRRLYRQRLARLVERDAVEARIRTARLKLERVRIGIELMERFPDNPPVVFSAVDLAEAEQAVVEAALEASKLEIEVEMIEDQIRGLVGGEDLP